MILQCWRGFSQAQRIDSLIGAIRDNHMTSTSSTFDPYQVWLGIPAAEQPVNHYRLLGVSQFEPDYNVIRDAAARLLPYFEGLRTSEHSAQAERLYNEVLTAEACLTDPYHKYQYDRSLKAPAAGGSEAAMAPPPPA